MRLRHKLQKVALRVLKYQRLLKILSVLSTVAVGVVLHDARELSTAEVQKALVPFVILWWSFGFLFFGAVYKTITAMPGDDVTAREKWAAYCAIGFEWFAVLGFASLAILGVAVTLSTGYWLLIADG